MSIICRWLCSFQKEVVQQQIQWYDEPPEAWSQFGFQKSCTIYFMAYTAVSDTGDIPKIQVCINHSCPVKINPKDGHRKTYLKELCHAAVEYGSSGHIR